MPTPDSTPSSVETDAVRLTRAHAAQSENALREMMLMQHGHRLAPSIRQWASASKLPTPALKGLLDAAPEPDKSPATRVAATRGATHGSSAVPSGNDALDSLHRRMGTFQASAPKLPHRNERGDTVFPMTTPREMQRILAANAAKGGK